MSAETQKSQQTMPLPSLPYDEWKETLDTLHMWMQIVGKIKLTQCPFINQWWEVAFQVTSRGVTTGRIPYKDEAFTIDFDFINHTLFIHTSWGKEKVMLLKPRSVAEFYIEFMTNLEDLGIMVSINPAPVEFSDPIPFKEDRKHKSYDKDSVESWWRIQLRMSFIFDSFQSSFCGKSSPIHFFWGSFDISGTRFSGKKTTPPKLPGVIGKIMEFAENEENFTFGFWPGDSRFPYPAFFCYIYPAPPGLENIDTGLNIAYFNKNLGEFILPYENIKKMPDPEKQILCFLETIYKGSAKLAGWNIEELGGPLPEQFRKK